MCPVCWINGLIAFLIGMGLLAVDSPYTPFLIGIAAVLTCMPCGNFGKAIRGGEILVRNNEVKIGDQLDGSHTV